MKFLLLLGFIGLARAQGECGQKPDQPPWEPQIVGGRNAQPGYWPWQLSLQYSSEEGAAFRHTCGAVLLDEDFALTAAHCVNGRDIPENFRLVAGAHNLTNLDGTEQILNIDLILMHERFIQDPTIGFPNDIAILRFSSPADLEGPDVGAVCLPRMTDMNFTANDECWISGWGLTGWLQPTIPDILQEANVEVPSNDDCFHFGFIRETHVCVGNGHPSACSGDSGGPLNCKVGDRWYVAGLTSWGVATCSGLPSVYTRTSKFWEWVDYNVVENRP